MKDIKYVVVEDSKGNTSRITLKELAKLLKEGKHNGYKK